VAQALRASTGGQVDLRSGTLYPALRRLESTGLMAGDWSEAGGQPRRSYALTEAGHAALAEQRSA
jgi:DNA-binding PadR family transcriptional regulator